MNKEKIEENIYASINVLLSPYIENASWKLCASRLDESERRPLVQPNFNFTIQFND